MSTRKGPTSTENPDDILRRMVNRQFPFGPQDSQNINDGQAAAALFDWRNHAFADLLRGSHLIIGRRGSGKSALLKSYHAIQFLNLTSSSQDGRILMRDYQVPSEALNSYPDIVVDIDTFPEVYSLELEFQNKPLPPPEILYLPTPCGGG
jgi:hypothetical protein